MSSYRPYQEIHRRKSRRVYVGKVPVGRIALLGFWWWMGWHFFAR